MTPAALSLPVTETETGETVYQPAEQAIELQVTELVGAEESDWAVKLVPLPVLPATSVAVTEPLCVAAEPVNVYAPFVFDQSAPRAG